MKKLHQAYCLRSTSHARLPAPANSSGSTLAEFAFVLPLLAMIMFGVIDFGRALYAYHFVSDAAREASRWASVRGNQCTAWPQACPANQADVQNYVAGLAPPGIDPSSQALSAAAAWMRPPENPASCVGAVNNPGCAVQVQVTYNFKFILPFLPKSTYSMQSTSEMIISH
jgi:Flp pilus assembly protein TadG